MKKYSIEYALEKAKNIEGWLTPNEMKLLYDFVTKSNTNGALVEIGSWAGKSMTIIVTACKEVGNNSEIFSIDPYLTSKDEDNHTYQKFVTNMKELGYWNNINQIKEKSQECGLKWNKPISFIFIDGFHSYDDVKLDFELYFKHILNGGYCILHDVTTWYGPTKLSAEILENRRDIEYIDLANSALALKKVEFLTEDAKVKNQQIVSSLKEMLNTKNLKK